MHICRDRLRALPETTTCVRCSDEPRHDATLQPGAGGEALSELNLGDAHDSRNESLHW